MEEIAVPSDIQPFGGIELFDPVPDYAIDALWLEWERNRRSAPPENMICTSARSYQWFCQKLKERQEELFPCTFTSRNTLLDITQLGAASYKQEEAQQLRDIVQRWDASDKDTYIAFIYEGRQHRNVIDGVLRQLAPRYAALRQAQ